jgi:hypothetical protein
MRSLRGLLENAAGVLEKCAATCGERHPTPVPGKERHIELVFETADFPAEMRLWHPEPRSGACEAQLFGDCDAWAHRPLVPTVSGMGAAHDRPGDASLGKADGTVLASCG